MPSVFAIRRFISRFAYAGLIGAAVALMLIGKIETVLFEEVRTQAIDLTAPLLELLSGPVATIGAIGDDVGELATLRDENIRLRNQNTELSRLQVVVQRLEGENQALRQLLKLNPTPAATFVTARVVADTGGAFAKSIVVGVGRVDGVVPRQIVMTGEGLVGRVQQVGEHSSRVLLISDINSKIPVVVGHERRRAILEGENTDRPRITHVDGVDDIKRGDLVLTAGYGGVFPTGLPVGVVLEASDRGAEVQPFVEWHRLEFVRVVDYSAVLPAGPAPPAPPKTTARR